MPNKPNPLLYLDPDFDPILITFPKGSMKKLGERLRHYYGLNRSRSLKSRGVMEDEEAEPLMVEEENDEAAGT